MADVEIPKSIPCQFDKAWIGACKKPSTNGWCSEHEDLKCASCGHKAVKSCEAGASLVCGASLCNACTHAPRGGGHVTNEVANAFYKKENEQEAATKTSRTSPAQRMHESLGVPLNLFELKKGDVSQWPVKEFYYLELKHGLMGFFPAIVKAQGNRVITTLDRKLIERIWRMLSPRLSNLVTNHGYVNEDHGLLYPIIGSSQFDLEDSKPQKIFTEAEFLDLTKDGQTPFMWAPGLVGGPGMTEKDFLETIEAVAREYDVSLSVNP